MDAKPLPMMSGVQNLFTIGGFAVSTF
jgi:hypothetical protein